MQLCRGPLPDGHPKAGVIYFSPDQDLAPQACNLAAAPPIEPFRHVNVEAVLLDAHRAPDEWFAAAMTMPMLTVQGDPDSYHYGHERFAAELAKAPASGTPASVLLEVVPTLTEGLRLAQGRKVVLVGSRATREALWAHLRPTGLQPGDPVMDMYGVSGVVVSVRGDTVFTDGGRRCAPLSRLHQHLIVSPAGVRASEWDSVIVMPDVGERIARAVCRRTRHMIIGVAHSPYGYAPLIPE